jgi:hypothetical protein
VEDHSTDVHRGRRVAASVWLVVHLFWVGAFLLTTQVGAEDRFCTSFDRPMYDAGPSAADPDFTSGLPDIADSLLNLGFILAASAVALSVLVGRWRRRYLRFALMNFMLGGLAAAVTVRIMFGQWDDGSFCSLGSKLLGFAGLAAMVATAAGLNLVLVRRHDVGKSSPISAATDPAPRTL